MSTVDVRVTLQFAVPGAITLGVGDRPVFPALPAGPGVYRIRLSDPDGSRHSYVGQSDNLRRRGSSYRSPGPTQGTSRRINQIIRIILRIGGHVTIELATAGDVRTETGSEPLDLTVKEHRVLAEQAALLATKLDPAVQSLNR